MTNLVDLYLRNTDILGNFLITWARPTDWPVLSPTQVSENSWRYLNCANNNL